MSGPRPLARLGLALAVLLGAGAAQAVPEIQHWTTDKGARVYFVETHALPIVDLRVVFDAGSSRSPERPGLSSLVNGLLREGTGELDAEGIAKRVEGVGAQLGNGALRDMAWVSLRSLSDADRLETAVAVAADVLAAPSFPADAVERDRKAMLVNLELRQQSASNVASDAFYRALYGDHPYAIGPHGTRESLEALTREEVLGFYRRHYVAANATVAIVGDLDREQAEALAERMTGRLAAGERPPALPEPKLPEQGRSVRIDFPSAQTHVLAGHPALGRGDPDYYVLYTGNHVLGGGGFTSRLVEEIREDRGLSYSVYSAFVPMAQEGPFQLGLQTANDQVERAVEVMYETVGRFREQGPASEELEKAILNITGSFPLKIDSNANIVQYLAMIGFYDLPLDYLADFNDHIRAVTVKQVKDAFHRRLHPDRMITVVVGGPPAVAAPAPDPLEEHVRGNGPHGIR